MPRKIFGKANKAEQIATAPYFKTFTEYAPTFSTYEGSVYEQALTRAAIERFATGCTKLKPEIVGSAKPRIHRAIASAPNSYMSWAKFIGRVATILEIDTTAFIVPAFDNNMNIIGVYPLKASSAEIVEYNDEPWVRFHFATGDTAALELKNVCILTRFQYESDYFGGGNAPLNPTMQLIHSQDEAQEVAIKNGADIRFIAQVPNLMHGEDIEKKRKLFTEQNLSANNKSGLMIYDSTFRDVKQIEPKSYTIANDEMERIKDNVFTYFGTNEKILQNDYNEESWDAYYEGKIEPFAVQLSEGLTQMLFTPNEQARGNRIIFSANRLAFSSNASKRNMCRDMVDRPIMTINEARAILQLPPVQGGDVFMPRGEYHPIHDYELGDPEKFIDPSRKGKLRDPEGDPSDPLDYDADRDLGGDDQEYKDDDTRGDDDHDWGM